MENKRTKKFRQQTEEILISEYQELANFYVDLSQRHQKRPIFLNRNLSYMNRNSIKSGLKIHRKHVKVDNFFYFERQMIPVPHMEDDRCPEYIFRFVIDKDKRIWKDSEVNAKADCPWCSTSCKTLKVLQQHIDLTHLAFEVKYNESEKMPILEISLIDSETILKKNRKYDLRQKSYIFRETNMPMPIHEVVKPQIEDLQTSWVLEQIERNIDDFTDVNDGEKIFMKMWSIFITKFTATGDCHLPRIIDIFIELKGREIIERKLQKNFMLHLINVFDFNCITAKILYDAAVKFGMLIVENRLQNIIVSDPSHTVLDSRNTSIMTESSSNVAEKSAIDDLKEISESDGETLSPSSQSDSGVSLNNHCSTLD